MSGVYIPGMEMPEDKVVCLLVCPDGRVTVKTLSGFGEDYKAIPVPDHGRLIDADTLSLFKETRTDTRTGRYEELVSMAAVRNVKTIIPADPAEEGEG